LCAAGMQATSHSQPEKIPNGDVGLGRYRVRSVILDDEQRVAVCAFERWQADAMTRLLLA